MTRDLPQFLSDLLRSPPRAGQGVHDWLFRVARQLHAHLPAGEIVRLLEDRTANCGRHVPRAEIQAAVKNSIECAWQPSGRHQANQTASKWPEVDKARVETITGEGYGLADLWEASPIRIEHSASHTEDLINQLFCGNPLLCCGKYAKDSNGDLYTAFDTKPRDQWRGKLSKLELIVPSPMSALTGLTKDGKESAHTLSNTGARRFQITEFDTGSTDHHAALLLHLARYAPLVCAVHSGGKSLHGWFFCAGQDEDRVLKFFRYAVSLGADHATWTRSQFVRLPDGKRNNGNRQTVFFFHPRPLEMSR